jgi:hypothetical protein
LEETLEGKRNSQERSETYRRYRKENYMKKKREWITDKGAERLLKLARYLKNVVAKNYPDKFDMNQWATGKFKNRKEPNCGTVACALGWATLVFPRDLRIGDIISSVQVYTAQVYTAQVYTAREYLDHEYPELGKFVRTGEDAAAVFFHINYKTAIHLFHPGRNHRTAAQVAKNFELFIKTGKLPRTDPSLL